MKTTQKIIRAGFAACALASVSLPALSWTVWPDIDFQWYADVGKGLPGTTTAERFPAPREGYIWSPGHYERAAGNNQRFVAGRWIVDDYAQQVAKFSVLAGARLATVSVPTGTPLAVTSVPGGTQISTGPVPLYDRQGNPIPMASQAYPIGSVRK